MDGTIRRSHWYTVKETAKLLGQDPETIRRRCRDGDLDAVFTHMGTGGGWRITHETIEREIKSKYPHLKLDLDEGTRDDG